MSELAIALHRWFPHGGLQRIAGAGEVLSGPLRPGQLTDAIRRALEVPADERRRAALAWASRLPRDAFRHAVLDRVAERLGH